jgi:hypothetical protein
VSLRSIDDALLIHELSRRVVSRRRGGKELAQEVISDMKGLLERFEYLAAVRDKDDRS